jgi:hypothetical protein
VSGERKSLVLLISLLGLVKTPLQAADGKTVKLAKKRDESAAIFVEE